MSADVHRAWTPSLGAWVEPDGTAFRVWAPCSSRVDVIVERTGGPSVRALARSPEGTFSAVLPDGRRKEFRDFAAFSDPMAREQIPDPQALETFLSSRLAWDERLREPHASTRRLYQALLTLRRREPALRNVAAFHVAALDNATIAIRRDGPHDTLLVVARLRGAGLVDVTPALGAPESDTPRPIGRWQLILTSEDPAFSPDPSPPVFEDAANVPIVRFVRPSAVILRRIREESPQ